jgi:high-affinity Fe2+/Pb2+ permease
VSEDQIRLTVAVVLSAVLLAAGLYVLLGESSNPDLQKAATGWIGVIIGYWFK